MHIFLLTLAAKRFKSSLAVSFGSSAAELITSAFVTVANCTETAIQAP